MRFYVVLILSGLCASSLDAEQTPVSQLHVTGTQIRTTATATRFIPPDLAIAQFEFSARDSTLSAAARAASVIGNEIRRAIIKAGVPGDSILGRGSVPQLWDRGTQMDIKVNSEFKRYDTTYVFRDIMVVRIRDLKRVGSVLDAALEAGAHKLVSLQFSSGRIQPLAREALTEATRQARLNAEVMAEAGGGRVGRPLELTTDKTASGESFYDLRPTNSSPGAPGSYSGLRTAPPDAELRVSVYGRWELLPAADSVPR